MHSFLRDSVRYAGNLQPTTSPSLNRSHNAAVQSKSSSTHGQGRFRGCSQRLPCHQGGTKGIDRGLQAAKAYVIFGV